MAFTHHVNGVECETQIFQEHQLVVDVVRGEVTVDELRDKFASLFKNPEYDDSMRGLCDLRNATSRMNRTDFQHLSNELAATSDFGQARWAIVTENPILTAFAQIFQRRVGEDENIKVFSTLEAAEAYLKLPVRSVLGED